MNDTTTPPATPTVGERYGPNAADHVQTASAPTATTPAAPESTGKGDKRGKGGPGRVRTFTQYLLVLVVGIILGFWMDPETAAPATPAPSPAAAAPAPTAPAPVEQAPAPAPAPVAPAGPLTSVTDGSYEVGTDADQIKAGKWHTDGKTDGIAPYAVVNGANGDIVKVINLDGPYTITLKNGQQFETHGGATWTQVK